VQIERLRRDLEESRERTRQGVETYAFLEGRLREAEERVAKAIGQGTGAESKLAEFETALHAAEARAAQAETQLGRLREAEAEAEKLRRELLEERESGRGGLDEDELARLNDRMESAERRAVEADRRLRELAKLARAAELVQVPRATERREPAAGGPVPAKPAAGAPQRTAPPVDKPVPAPAKPAAGAPRKTEPAAPRKTEPAAPGKTEPGAPGKTAPDAEDELDSPEPDLPRHARNLRERLTRTAMLKKLGHKDEDQA
jgi:hypothetical protein